MIPFSKEDLEPRLWESTILKDGHRLWMGPINLEYGMLHLYGKNYGVHRISAFLYLGLDLADSKQQANHIDELCIFKNCWEPTHLYVGSKLENLIDCMKSGNAINGNTYKTHCKRGHEFTEENTYRDKKGRRCRTCVRHDNQRRCGRPIK